MSRRLTDRETLAAILPALNAVHGGCAVCLTHLAQAATDALHAGGSLWQLQAWPLDHDPGKARIVLVLSPGPGPAAEQQGAKTTGETPVR